MFREFWKHEPTPLEAVIEDIYVKMQRLDATEDEAEYKKCLKVLERLEKLHRSERSNGPSKDTIIIVAGGLVQILIIVAYEQRHVITTKGIPFILKAGR